MTSSDGEQGQSVFEYKHPIIRAVDEHELFVV